MRVSLLRDGSLSPADLAAVRHASLGPLLRRCGDELGLPSRSSLCVRLTGEAELRALNARFRGEDRPTDVLAFPGQDRPAGGGALPGQDPAAGGGCLPGQEPSADRRPLPARVAPHVGDIAISVERARRQGDDPVDELRLLAVHGLLHCIGHDHGEPREAAAMTAATRRLLPHQAVPEL